MKKKYCIFFLVFSLKIFATHIVGGEIIYEFINTTSGGDNRYRVILKIYRDCASGNAPFDAPGGATPAVITVREGNGTLFGTFNVGAPVVQKIEPTINSPCIKTPVDVCVEEGIYTTTLTLPPKAGGYYIIYQRCCRNNTINNIITPGNVGSSYFTKIPGTDVLASNNSPRFKKFPPVFLCANLSFTFDHSATDPDNDSLVYSFYTPFQGLDPCCPGINSAPGSGAGCGTSPNCPIAAAAPPYPNVIYAASYSGNYPVSSNPSLTIDPATGLLTGKPDLIGQFVVGICVREYHNGVLLNTHYRDFQFNIRSCVQLVTSDFKEQTLLCQGSAVTFTNLSIANAGTPSALWDFGVSTQSNDTSDLFNPSYNFPDTGKFTVTLIANPRQPCSDTVKKNLYIYPPLDISFLPPPKQCFKNNSFNFNTQGVYTNYTELNWNFGSSASPSTSTQKNPSDIIFNSGGIFPVILTAKQALCRDTFVSAIRIVDAPPGLLNNKDTTIVIGQLAPLSVYEGTGYTYTWTPLIDYLNCSPCLIPDPVSSTMSDITYTVLTEEDSMHCFIITRTYRVLVEFKASVDFPTAFTPNGDGVNDIINVDGWGLRKLNYLKIFNRWGQLLFQTDDLKAGWDGKFNGVPQNMETYVYQVSVETYVKETPVFEKTGTFKLIR